MQIDKIGQSLTSLNQTKGSSESAPSFGEYLKDALDSANEAQIKADEEATKFATGQTSDIYESILSAEEARIQMEMVVQVRNKLVESYQEISRMQI